MRRFKLTHSRRVSDVNAERKVDDILYDFVRKRLNVVTGQSPG